MPVFNLPQFQMPAAILRLNPAAEFFTPESCFINELSNSTIDPGLSIARARVSAGVTTRWHRLKDTAERYVILEGHGQMEVGDLPPQEVRPGDVVFIPPLCRQRITNLSDHDLIFLALCTPRFRPENYEDIEAQTH
jgi:mannose-6-phosphate isomerase-like protein (cupin superfamily)